MHVQARMYKPNASVLQQSPTVLMVSCNAWCQLQGRWDTLATQAAKAQQAAAACTQYAENMLLEFAAHLALIAQDIAACDVAQQQQLQPHQVTQAEAGSNSDSAQLPDVPLSPGTFSIHFISFISLKSGVGSQLWLIGLGMLLPGLSAHAYGTAHSLPSSSA